MISIIVPIYNVEKYLAKCIDSILLQTYRDIQLILVDDGSLDSCSKICDEYAKNDSRICVIHKKNEGVSSARNAGLKIAQGEYIGFVDPDDWIATTMYEEMVGLFEQDKEIDLIICGYNYIKENGEIERAYQIKANELLSQEDVFDKLSDLPPTIRHGVVNKLFRKSLLQELCFNEKLHSAEDVLFVTEYVQRVKRAGFVHKPLYMNLIREGSATHGGLNAEKLATSFQVHENMYLNTIIFYPKLREHALAFLLDVCTLKYRQIRQEKGTGHWIKVAKKFIKKYAFKAVFNKEIYWKTRIAYLLLK